MDQCFLNNEIYKYLIDKKSSVLVSIIDTTYQHCEYILGEIPKEFSNYTIHDIHHAIRVINYMTEFVKPNINEYSDFHLALILLAGLLHDTGMFVSDEEKEEIISKIITEENKDNQQEVFQDYIRERHSKRVSIVLDNFIIDKDTGSKLSSIFRLDTYNFTDDIALICQSHTESLDWIKENIRVSKNLTKYSYNPQHIAMLLKLGDNLDIDARRAPYSLLKLLEIKGYNKTEWEKHSPISNYDKIKYLGNHRFHIWFDGKCNNAFIYRKVMEHILWLQNTCSEISSISSRYEKPFCFDFDEKIETKIEAIGFESTELQFSLNYSSVLKLLMGEQIYGEKKAGLRELLQNSIDAVLVMGEKLSNISTSNYQPTIWIEFNEKKNSLSICDNGTGMSSDVLEKYFFNVGKSYYLSDEYKKLNLNYSAIGHFGIGFLACFMLSSSVLLETQAIDCKPIAIEFERPSRFVTKLESPDYTFIEGHGTRIVLSYNEVIPHVFSSEKNLVDYVKNTFLIEGYHIKVVDNKNNVIEIQSNCKITTRHIHTDKFDIDYTLNKPPKFWYNFSQVFDTLGPILLPFDNYDLGLNGHRKRTIIELNKVNRIIDLLEQDPSEPNLDKRFDNIDCTDNDMRFFIIEMMKNCNDLRDLKKHINQFVLDKAYHDGALTCTSYSYIVQESNSNEFYDEETKRLIILGGEGFYYSDFYSIKNQLGNFLISRPHREKYPVLRSYDGSVYIPIARNVCVADGRIYMQGILVSDEKLFLPYTFSNLGFYNLYIKVKAEEYELNVSRKEFSKASKNRLNYEVTKEIYKDIALQFNNSYSNVEKQLLMQLIELLN